MKSKCPNCGGELRFDIEKQKVVCDFCDSTFDAFPEDDAAPAAGAAGGEQTPEAAAQKQSEKPKNAAKEITEEEAQAWNVSVFTCPNCGGELMSEDLDAIDYCPYCGSFVTLESHLTQIVRPQYIIPFKKTKEECRAAYKRKVRKNIFAPREFRDEKYLENFKSIYLPYWMYNFSYGTVGLLKNEKSYQKGNYCYTEYKNINFTVNGSANMIPYDASSSFDDTISARIAPFDPLDMQPFEEAAMFGMFADTADVDGDFYMRDAKALADKEFFDRLMNDPQIAQHHPTYPDSDNQKAKAVHCKARTPVLAMLPVWFLTWRKKDRVAYSVVNGQTGKISAEVPISFARFAIFAIILAIPLFFLLNSFLTLPAVTMMLIASVLTTVVAFVYATEFREVAIRESHALDKGYLYTHRDEEAAAKKLVDPKKNAKKKKKVRQTGFGKFLTIVVTIPFFIVCAIFAYKIISAAVNSLQNLGTATPEYAMLWYAAMDFLFIIALVRLFKAAKPIHAGKKAFFGLLAPIICMVVVQVIVIIKPVSDVPYYVGVVLSLVSVVATFALIIKRHNDLVTRPVPHFFDREKKR